MEDEDEISPSQEIDFCTLGMFIIGERGSLLNVHIHALSYVETEVEPCDTVNAAVGEVQTRSVFRFIFFAVITVTGLAVSFHQILSSCQ
jgi:hypothetical protein